jgi:hypothetical protein
MITGVCTARALSTAAKEVRGWMISIPASFPGGPGFKSASELGYSDLGFPRLSSDPQDKFIFYDHTTLLYFTIPPHHLQTSRRHIKLN